MLTHFLQKLKWKVVKVQIKKKKEVENKSYGIEVNYLFASQNCMSLLDVMQCADAN